MCVTCAREALWRESAMDKDTLSFTAPRTRMTDSLNRAPAGAVSIPVDRVVEVEVT